MDLIFKNIFRKNNKKVKIKIFRRQQRNLNTSWIIQNYYFGELIMVL